MNSPVTQETKPRTVFGSNGEALRQTGNPFNEGYFLRGEGSNYVNYRFLPELTGRYADCLVKHLDIKDGEAIHDIGASRGYLVKVLRDKGYQATGHDISEWAVQNCHPDVKPFLSLMCDYEPNFVDWIHGKDTFEHWDQADLEATLPKIFTMARKGCFFIVPLTAYWGGKYIYPADNEDKTHRIRLTIDSWLKMMMDAANKCSGHFSIHGSYHMHGLKKASEDYPCSTGFLTVKRFTV